MPAWRHVRKVGTSDGLETQFGTNHVAHFLLFYILRSRLLLSSTPTFHSRVILVASSAHRVSSVHFDNLSLKGEYEPWKAYGQSKTANIWMANEIERWYGDQGLHAYSLHPGAIATDLLRHVSDEQKANWEKNEFLTNYWKSPQQGAATTVWGAVARELEGTGGKYLDDCQVATPADPGERHGPGYAAWAYSPKMEAKLWDKTLELLNEDWKNCISLPILKKGRIMSVIDENCLYLHLHFHPMHLDEVWY